MYTPKAFEVTDLPMLHAAMKQSELATLVTITANGLVATHLPLLLDETRAAYGTLTGHVSRANLQWRESDPDAEALIIFLGLDSYVTPNWYPAKTGDRKSGADLELRRHSCLWPHQPSSKTPSGSGRWSPI